MTNAIELNEMELELVNGGASKTKYVNYTVVKGDNLHKIANKYKTTWTKIYNANKAKIGDNGSVKCFL